MGTPAAHSDWSFARRPFWLFSHVFAATVIISFVAFGMWQLGRHGQRADFNREVEQRSQPPALALASALDGSLDELDYQFVSGRGQYVADEIVRVANRTQGGVAGEHVVGVLRLDDGRRILVNRGFVPLDPSAVVEPAPAGPVVVDGWLRASVAKGWFGATDVGEGSVVPRLDVAAIEGRLSEPVVDVWLQLRPLEGAQEATFPDPVPLPSLDAGPHLGYMAQWFIFATLGVLFYGALLRRTARGRHQRVPEVPAAPT